MLARSLLFAILGVACGFPTFAIVGYFAIAVASSNHFDRSFEAYMTAAFVFGPIGSILGFFAGLIWGGRRKIPRGGSER